MSSKRYDTSLFQIPAREGKRGFGGGRSIPPLLSPPLSLLPPSLRPLGSGDPLLRLSLPPPEGDPLFWSGEPLKAGERPYNIRGVLRQILGMGGV